MVRRWDGGGWVKVGYVKHASQRKTKKPSEDRTELKNFSPKLLMTFVSLNCVLSFDARARAWVGVGQQKHQACFIFSLLAPFSISISAIAWNNESVPWLGFSKSQKVDGQFSIADRFINVEQFWIAWAFSFGEAVHICACECHCKLPHR